MKCIVTMWNSDTKLLATIFILVVLLMQTVECLKCVRCSSLFDRDCDTGTMAPKHCSKTEHYCITYEGTQESTNLKFVVRDCSDEDEKSVCRPIKVEKNIMNVCFKTCTTDGCNSAFSISNNSHVTIYVTSLLCVWFIYKHLFLENT